MCTQRRRASTLILALILACAAAHGAGFTSVDPGMGVIYIPTPDLLDAKGYLSGGPQQLTNFLAFGSTFDIDGIFSWEPGLTFYYGYDLWDQFNKRVLPTEQSWRTSFTLAFLIQTPLVATVRFAKVWNLALGLGPAFNLRYGMLASMSAADAATAAADIPKINNWFYARQRWFQPETFLRLGYKLTDRVDFYFTALACWPAYNLWIKSAMKLDGAIFGGEISIKSRFE
ncbi:MAG: hypothetical protein WCQ50_09600 [Spirochaetota bacterium]